MSSKNKTQVLLGGKIYTLSGYESEEYLQKVATYINNKISELKKMEGFNHLSSDTKSILIDLNVADDYFKAKKQADNIEEELGLKEKELYELKHELINVQIKLETAEKSLSTLQLESTEQQKRIVKLETELQDLRKIEKEGAV
ncbi:MAG: cell division protein ZapA [Lachnospiraceae bacterium]|nr:cell division protein ZapA [Robinsoniella sp.]MDY3767654.1 cell division protein ZapA [Lachnospiraceae bacterium]